MKEDLRIVKSKEKIYDALATLMLVQEYEDIQLMDIAKQAKVSRQTIYRNFQHKEHILLDRFDRWFHQVLEDVKALEKTPDKVNHLFSKVGEDLTFFRLLAGAHLDMPLLRYFNEITQAIVPARPKATTYVDQVASDLWIQYHAGGLFQLYRSMLNETTRLRPDELTQLFLSLVYQDSQLEPSDTLEGSDEKT